MEGLPSPAGASKTAPTRKPSSAKDLCFISKQGSSSEVDAALAALKKNGGNIDERNVFGLTPLHIATWRNHLPILKRLLASGADPDARDGESGWSSLHRALHFGHLSVAGLLIQSGASLILEDPKGRTPIDLLSGPVSQIIGDQPESVETEVFSWGSGTNYQLGTGNAHIQKLPCKVDALHGSYIKSITAGKFHSVAVGLNGELFTWGFGRGGRLGHPDFDIHSGQAAVITPRQVMVGLGSRKVKVVAAAKHHTVIATQNGEVFTWGSNREGQLGYTSVDTQPTPRRVTWFKLRIADVAAANKHSAAVAESGEVFTWGCNKEGQLGYGTSNSASNYTPRLVEYLKGKVFRSVSAAKYHTVALTSDGEVFTWGHRLVTPRRVVIARSLKKGGNTLLKFHRVDRIHVVSVAAGAAHTTALTDDGSLFYWVSADPDLRCQQLYSTSGRNFVSISAGKYWTAGATTTGDIYMFDGKKNKENPHLTRLHGLKRATSVCVGETHLLALCSLFHPTYPPKIVKESRKSEELDEELMFGDERANESVTAGEEDVGKEGVPSLKSLCEKVAVEYLLEPRSSIQLMEIADSLDASELKKHCEEIAIRNLDYIFTVAPTSIMNASSEILAKLERLLDEKSTESWSHRRLPTLTATHPPILDSDKEEDQNHTNKRASLRTKNNHLLRTTSDSFLKEDNIEEQQVMKQVRAIRKKLQQIEMLEKRRFDGEQLDEQQIKKVETRVLLEGELAELGFPYERVNAELTRNCSGSGKGSEKSDSGKKQRRKNKQKNSDNMSVKSEDCYSVSGLDDNFSLIISEEKMEKETDKVSEKAEDTSHMENTPQKDSTPKSTNNNRAVAPVSSKSKKNRKGGLSLFLSGALDETPKPAPPPPVTTPKTDSPAWGGAKFAKGPSASSLLAIQNEQKKTKIISKTDASKAKEQQNTEGQRIPLASFFNVGDSSPIAVDPVRGGPMNCEGEKERNNTPPWNSAGSSPSLSRPSLRDIQMQQEKKLHGISQSPKTRTSGFSIPSQTIPAEISTTKDSVPNRWYRPDTDAPSSLRSIQIEERAMKDLKRFYSSVKIVKPQM
ncbi:hypothetical protein LUZ60_010251 [Juncus effusus]|nr:hypothetical protein LUZ60_010251 [Juncus effusus]